MNVPFQSNRVEKSSNHKDLSLSGKPSGLHWATIIIGRTHRAEDIQTFGEWTCPCRSCDACRRALRAEAGGAL